MSDETTYDTPTASIEVRIFRNDLLVATELCESEAEATQVIDRWCEVENTTFLVDDVSFQHTPTDILAPEIPAQFEGPDED